MNDLIVNYINVISTVVWVIVIFLVIPLSIIMLIREQYQLRKFKIPMYDKLKIMDIDYDMARNLQICLRMKTNLVLWALRKLKSEIDFDNSLDEETILLYRGRVNNLISIYEEKDPFNGLPEEIKSSLQRLKNQFEISDTVHLDNVILAIKKALIKKNRIAILIGIIGLIINLAPYLSIFF